MKRDLTPIWLLGESYGHIIFKLVKKMRESAIEQNVDFFITF